MLVKQPKKSSFRRFIGTSLKAVFIAEALGIAVSYGLWFRLNNERGKSDNLKMNKEICPVPISMLFSIKMLYHYGNITELFDR